VPLAVPVPFVLTDEPPDPGVMVGAGAAGAGEAGGSLAVGLAVVVLWVATAVLLAGLGLLLCTARCLATTSLAGAGTGETLDTVALAEVRLEAVAR
jgi:hypothetical protein